MRDEFPLAIKRALAGRVNYCCSNPSCGAPTSGPQVEPGKSLNIGVAAHITAAAQGGPRYDPKLGREQRSSDTNGVWLCQNCAKLVDNDRTRFPEETLRRWKRLAESNARDKIGRQLPFERSSAPRISVAGDLSTSIEYTERAVSSEETFIELKDVLRDQIGDGDIHVLDAGRGSFDQRFATAAIGMNFGWDWKVIFLCAGEFGWEIIARIDLSGQKGYVPKALYVPGFPGALALTHLSGHGSGVFRQSMSWYRIARGEALPLLSFPVRFYVAGWSMPFDRSLICQLLSTPARLQLGAILELEFAINYTIAQSCGDIAGLSLFSTKVRISLEWNENGGSFVPYTDADDLARIDEIWNESTDGFIKRNFTTLQRLALDGTPEQRQFVRRYLLPDISDTG